MRAEEVLAHLARRLPQVLPAAPPQPLVGGLLNQTWRVAGRSGCWVVKHAPPYIATAPTVPLDPGRLAFEARALAELAPGGRLEGLASDTARAPLPVDFDPRAHVLVMEDVGPADHLGVHLAAGADLGEPVRRLGHFIGRLHAVTLDRADLAADFNNLPIQRTRHQVQYARVGALLETAGVADAAQLGGRAIELGKRLQAPGRCLVMGDLWPPSLLVTSAGVRVIDWEFVHFGSPAQDLGHLAAHLWMLRHRAGGGEAAAAVSAAWRRFLDGYREAAEARLGTLLDAGVRHDLEVHLAAEILVRVVGPFSAASLYDDAPPETVAEAVEAAAGHLRRPGVGELDELV